MTRYSASGDEAENEPGSNGRVLRNKLGIIDPAEIQEAELELLFQLYEEVLPAIPQDQTLTTSMIKEWHRKWLASVYTWAGQLRTVDLEKDGFRFASAAQIPRLLDELDRQVLERLTPCEGMPEGELARAIAEVHVELVLIHPFREGNGRIARFVADAMASQAAVGSLDYTAWDERKQEYISAIHAGLDRDYGRMERLVSLALDGGNGNAGT